MNSLRLLLLLLLTLALGLTGCPSGNDDDSASDDDDATGPSHQLGFRLKPNEPCFGVGPQEKPFLGETLFKGHVQFVYQPCFHVSVLIPSLSLTQAPQLQTS